MHTLTLTFTCSNGNIHIDAETGSHQRARGTFVPPFDGKTLVAVITALEPGFDDEAETGKAVITTLQVGGLPTGRDKLMQAVGERLNDAMDAALTDGQDNIWRRTLFDATHEKESLHLDLRFEDGCDRVAALPWELLRRDGYFLVADNSVTLTRSLDVDPTTEQPAALPLRILLVLAEPLGASPIAPEHQARELARGLRHLAADGRVVVDELTPPTYDELVEALRGGGYHVLHFYGHGVYQEGEGHLLFENQYGGPDLVKAEDVGAVLHNSGVRLVVMGACQSAMSGAEQSSSTAAALLRTGVPLVIGMQVSLLVVAAQAFTRQLYTSLAQGRSVTEALGDARLPLRRGNYGQSWYIPALFTRPTSDVRLFDPDAHPDVPAETITQLQTLQSEVEQWEDAVCSLGAVLHPAEIAGLRQAQATLRAAQDKAQRAMRRTYRPVVGPLYGVPSEHPHFVGRVEQMQRVAEGLAGRMPTAIWGLGGIGKSTLAAEAARRQHWRFPDGVLWLDCRGGSPFDSLLNQIGAFCGHAEVEQMESEQRLASVRAWLAGMERCLLVWDNAEDVWGERAVRDFIRQTQRSCTHLITTRENPEQAGWPTVELDPLPNTEMRSLFYILGAAAGVKVWEADLPLIDSILDWLDGHPLALMLVIPLARKRGLQLLWTSLQAQPLEGIDAAFAVSYEALTNVQQRLFTNLSAFTIPFAYEAAEAMFPDERNLENALDVVVQQALVTFDGRNYGFHPLVRQYAYGILTTDEQLLAHRKAAEYLEAKSETGWTPEEHLESVDQWRQAKEWETFAWRASALVVSLSLFGYWPEIEHRLEQALIAVQRYLDDVILEVQLLYSKAIVVDKQARWDEAISLWETCAHYYADAGNEQGKAGVWLNLGNVYARKGELDKAAHCYQKQLSVTEKLGDLVGQSNAFMGLGLVYTKKRNWDRAIEMYRCSLETMKRMGDEHGIAQIQVNLGLVYVDNGTWDQAKEMFERSLEAFQIVGDVHDMAQTWGNLGLVYAGKGDWDQAIEMYEKSLNSKERMGDEHGIAQIQGNLGLVYANKGDWDRAIEMYECSLETKRRLGDVHGIALTVGNLGLVYADRGDWDRAIEMYECSLETKENLGDVHGMAQTWGNLGLVYADKGEWDRAIEMYERSLETFQQFGDMHGMAQIWTNIGWVFLKTDHVEDAKPLFAKAYLVFSKAGSYHAQEARTGLYQVFHGSEEATNTYLEQLMSQESS